jgi:hypothetical protein
VPSGHPFPITRSNLPPVISKPSECGTRFERFQMSMCALDVITPDLLIKRIIKPTAGSQFAAVGAVAALVSATLVMMGKEQGQATWGYRPATPAESPARTRLLTSSAMTSASPAWMPSMASLAMTAGSDLGTSSWRVISVSM